MDILLSLFDFILHIDKHLAEIISSYGTLTYGVLFLIVFCETGLVVTPFLPGDSLLFAAGALTASTGAMNIHLLALLLFIAAVVGDATNYHIGKFVGPKVFDRPDSLFIKKSHLERTQQFYEKYGGKTIIIARFVPIVRTFAPFLAGIGVMSYQKFFAYNIIGAALWVSLFCYGGFIFGELPAVKQNFTLVIFAIIVISVLPAVIEIIRARRQTAPQQ